MHVLLIVSWYKTESQPLLGSFFEEQARALMKRGVQVGILYPMINLKFTFSRLKTPPTFLDNSLPTLYHFSNSVVPRSRKINYLFYSLSSEKRFEQYSDIYGKPDIIHAHCVFSAGIIARHLSLKYHIPFLTTEHYTGLVISNVLDIKYNNDMCHNVFNSSSSSIAVSSAFAGDLCKKLNFRRDFFDVIPNLVSDFFFSTPVNSVVKDKIVFFSNSFLTAKKNHKLLLDSFRLVASAVPNSVLYIGGDGILRPTLEKYSADLNISDKVVFLGLLTRSEVKSYLDGCDIFLSTSIYETFGIAIAEALASGKPVVATNSGGPKDIIGLEDGMLVENHNPSAFSDSILAVLERYSEYNANIIQERCSAKFSEAIVVEQLIGKYHQALKV